MANPTAKILWYKRKTNNNLHNFFLLIASKGYVIRALTVEGAVTEQPHIATS